MSKCKLNIEIPSPNDMYSSSKVASFGTKSRTGWWDRHGNYFGNDDLSEHLARYSGCTYKKCDKCGEVYKKNGYCPTCYAEKRKKKFEGADIVPWDGESMVYSETLDEYFSDLDIAIEDGDEHGLKPSELMLYECQRIILPELGSDYLYGELSEDDNCLEEIEGLIEKFNEGLKNITTNTWYPNSNAIDVKEYENVQPTGEGS